MRVGLPATGPERTGPGRAGPGRGVLSSSTRRRSKRTLELEREVFGEMAALVVAAQQEQCRRVRQLQRPQVQHALHVRREERTLS